jgi:catechol 2,3-dioxygenase-like lactoylglutathione lyase family enzyme
MTASPAPVPAGVRGLRHLALKVTDLARSREFYETLFGMKVVWEPDPENVYLSSGTDNLALHQVGAEERGQYRTGSAQFLDHLGFVMDRVESVDALYRVVEHKKVPLVKAPKRHRDGSYSFYIADPDGNVVQVLYEPNISGIT